MKPLDRLSHPYTRKWMFETLISQPNQYDWKHNELNKCLYAIAEKYIRDKRVSQPHVDTFNMFITQYLHEILESPQDSGIFIHNEEHVVTIDNVRLLLPTESHSKTSVVLRVLPDQANKRGLNYSFGFLVDIVYKVYKCPIPFPPDIKPEHMAKFEKDWLKLRDLHRKKIGRQKYYASYAPEDCRVVEILKDCSLGPNPTTIGSLLCHLQKSLLQPGEGLFDPFGIYCVGGTFRLIPPLKDLMLNQDFVDLDNKYASLEIWSSNEKKLHYSTHSLTMYYDKKLDKNGRCKRDISLTLPFCRCALSITTIFWSLGWKPHEMVVAVRMAARKQWKPIYYEILNVIIQNNKCQSEEDAFLEILEVDLKNLNDPKSYLLASARLKIAQQLLPRIGQTQSANNAKARYLGYAIWRILMLGEEMFPNDPCQSQDRVTLQFHTFQIPKWMKVMKSGEIRIKKKHRDHLANCRSDFHGVLLAALFRQIFGGFWKQVKSHLQATLAAGKPVFLSKVFKHNKKLAARIQYCINTGKWSSSKEKDSRKNITQPFTMTSHIAQESHLTYHSTAMNPDGKNIAPRQINESQFFNLCPAETPETKKCGLTGHSSQIQDFCVGSPATEVEKTLKFYQDELYFIPDFRWIEMYRERGHAAFDDFSQIFLNGKPIGYTLSPERFIKFFWLLRRTMTLDPYASIMYDPIFDILQIRTDRSRVCVPFLIFPRLHHVWKKFPELYRQTNVPTTYITGCSGVSFHAPAFVGPRAMLGISRKYRPVSEDPDIAMEQEVRKAVLPWTVLHTFHFYHLVGQGLIDFLDPSERKITIIAMHEEDFRHRQSRGQLIFTHIALDPQFMLSVTTGITPFPDHNQSPRNTYQAAMAKSNVDLPYNLHVQLKTKHELFYCQAPFVHTITNGYRNGYLSNSNLEPITGLLTHFGYTVEDAQNMSKPFTRRGGGLMATTKTFKSEHKRKKSSSTREAFGKPTMEECVNLKLADYNTVTDQGIPLPGTKIKNRSVVIAQTSHYRHPFLQGLSNANKVTALKKKRRCNSIVYNQEEEATVSSSVMGTNLDGTQFCRVECRSMRYFEKGDKGSTAAAQKGTLSYFPDAQDLVECADGSGVVIEYLINAQALPKRMTCAMLIEQIFSLAVTKGFMRFSDATAFRDQINNLDDLKKLLRRFGLSFRGSRFMDGRTGRIIESLIFFGCVRYSRLKHMTKDKRHVRGASGPVNLLTRQAVEGRSKYGGLRQGEMERGCYAGHNAALLLRQQYCTIADPYSMFICKNCGLITPQRKDEKIAFCKVCKTTRTVLLRTCYAYKLLHQELFSMMIFLKMIMGAKRKNSNPYRSFTFVKEEDLYR